jgi:Na+/glutamate symporter
MINQIAMFTAIIATIGAIFGYMGGATQANAGLYKNNAAIKKTEASNQWNYFQSKSTKQSLAEMSRDLSTKEEDKTKYQSKVDRYEKEKTDIKVVADKLEAEATEWDHQSDEQMHQHHRWAQSTTVLQVCIALAAIALLTKKKWLEYAMFGAGGIGLAVGVLAALHI